MIPPSLLAGIASPSPHPLTDPVDRGVEDNCEQPPLPGIDDAEDLSQNDFPMRISSSVRDWSCRLTALSVANHRPQNVGSATRE